MPLQTLTVTISAGQSLSNAVDCSQGKLVLIEFPAAWDGEYISLQTSADGNTWHDFHYVPSTERTYSKTVDEIIIAVPKGAASAFATGWADNLLWLRIRSGPSDGPINQTADRIFTLTLDSKVAQLPAISKIATNPADTNSTTEVTMGLGNVFTITPVQTGRVAIVVGGTCANDSVNGGLNITGRYGTGTTPPANGAAGATFGVWSTTQHYYMSNARDIAGFTVIGGFVGLTDGTPVWFDLSIAATGGGRASVTDVQCLIWEL